MSEMLKKELVQRITRNLLDIQILRLIQTEPMWGYTIKKRVELKFQIKLRHGALYPLLNRLEDYGFSTSHRQYQSGRMRKVYEITQKGLLFVQMYKDILREQLDGRDIG